MPGATNSQRLPYPYLDEPVTDVDVYRLAASAAILLTNEDAARTRAVQKPSCATYRNANQSIPNNTITTISFDFEQLDPAPYDMINIGGQPTRVSVTTAAGSGTYAFAVCVLFPGLSSGAYKADVEVYRTGTLYSKRTYYTNPAPEVMYAAGSLGMTGGTDYLEVKVFQNSGGAVNMSGVLFKVWKETS
jgi:hypothetical protein